MEITNKKRKSLWITSGPSGSGKSYWCQQAVQRLNNTLWISRDKIRFSLIKEDEPYFKKEKLVFSQFVQQIQQGLCNYDTVFADATHITKASRLKLLHALKLDEDIDIYVAVFFVPDDVCLERNSHRQGREKVPKTVIKHMCQIQTDPKLDNFPYKAVYYL